MSQFVKSGQLWALTKIVDNAFYVFGEDFASALVGPFDTAQQAQDHIAFCITRGDGATMEVVSSFIAARLDEPNVFNTPEEDRAFEL